MIPKINKKLKLVFNNNKCDNILKVNKKLILQNINITVKNSSTPYNDRADLMGLP